MVAGAVDVEAGSLARLQLNVLASFAELEREMIGERLADARAARKARGLRAAGRVRLGYATDSRTKQLVIDEAEAATVRWFFEQAARGVSTGDLVDQANRCRNSNTTGGRAPWSSRSVLRLLRNPTYAGLRPDGVPGAHAAIISRELFDGVQTAITARRTRRFGRRRTPDWHIDPYSLRGLVDCELCGKTMTTSMSRALNAKTAKSAPRYYRCRTLGCDGGQVAAARLEKQVFDALRHPHPRWPARTVQRMAECASVWHVMSPHFRCLALTQVFESLTWRPRTGRLLVKGRTDWSEIDAALAERKLRNEQS